ncbi:polyisoprenoid-binding protein YceI [Arcticibacter pallidicorallinus]|uniref:Polyisoprenoid-binding protein YceI n=1 Tax=Arcticibacter pallidicorallinus TaxID=1259464 RepID=A0A2T0TU57_9SPHI|nr:YceI family protein [Arcticibacter pallidicorallinus]PRY49183.1 polyisoprenoid-binding protein YceI [Arcticibacter pallidicorallinus]
MKTATITHFTKNLQKTFVLLTFAFSTVAFTQSSIAQTYKIAPGSEIKVDGTSNIHDWNMKTTTMSGDAQVALAGKNLTDVKTLNFSTAVKNLKGKEDLLNSRAHKAMKADKFPTIAFKLNSATVSGDIVKGSGSLTIAGVTKEIAVQGKAVENADGSLSINGSRKIKMSEYGIQPPSFMLGALKVADEINVTYTLKLKK